mmetsp:Transcript_4305/g.10581  ORF Transcript_4305/g.10581 Transcript_4305/m.10581 type:complete len:99 (+) Transcript_4305:360-656(+)
MKRLKSLELSIYKGDSWDGLLEVISNLELLENLKYCWKQNPPTEPSKKGLLLLANGLISTCEIEILTQHGINEQLHESLIQCFESEVLTSFEKGSGKV